MKFIRIGILIFALLTVWRPPTAGAAPQDVKKIFPGSVEKSIRPGDKVALPPSTTFEGKPFRFEAAIGRKPTVLVYWVSSCGRCIEEMKRLRGFLKSAGLGNRVSVVTINNVDSPDDVRDGLRAMRGAGLAWPIVRDERAYYGARLRVSVMPAFLLVDAKGVLQTPPVNLIDTPVRSTTFRQAVVAVLKGKRLPPIEFTEYTYEETMNNAWDGKQAPAFELPDLIGTTRRLSDALGKGPVILYFWHPSSDASREQLKRLTDYYAEKKADGPIEMLAVTSVAKADQRVQAATLETDYRIDYPILQDNDFAVTKRYDVRKIPLVWLLDRDGIVRKIFYGNFTDTPDRLDPVVNPLMK